MDIEKIVRNLAKSYKYQALSSGGETPLNCFINKNDFTFYQLYLISYIKFYSALLTDVNEEEVDEIVLSDNVYEDAYMYWRGKYKYKKLKEDMDKKFQPQINRPGKQVPVKETQKISGFKWDFRNKK